MQILHESRDQRSAGSHPNLMLGLKCRQHHHPESDRAWSLVKTLPRTQVNVVLASDYQQTSEQSFLAAHRLLTPHRLGARTGVTFRYTVRREGSRGHPGPHLLVKKATPRGTQITNPCLTNHRAGEPTRALQEKPKDPGA